MIKMGENIELSNGALIEFDEQDPFNLFEAIINDILIPRYKDKTDWNLSLNIILEEINRIISKYQLSPKLKLGLLNQVEKHLDKDIQELTGVDKIEILFLNLDDYLEDIKNLIISGLDKHELRTSMANLIYPLTIFELGELFIFLGKKAFLK
jgi:hypothetical protein